MREASDWFCRSQRAYSRAMFDRRVQRSDGNQEARGEFLHAAAAHIAGIRMTFVATDFGGCVRAMLRAGNRARFHQARRSMSTEHGEWRTRRSAVLSINAREEPVCPCGPTMIRSAASSRAAVAIST